MPSPIRIVELRTTYRDGGGPDKTILLSARAHDRARFDVRCVYLRGAADQAFSIGRRAQAMGVPLEEVLEHRPVDLRAFAGLVRCIRRHRPHIIHAHDYKTDILGYILQPFFGGAALLATAHGWTFDNRRMGVYNRLDRWALRQYHHVIAVSEATRTHLENAGVPASRTSVLYNGIDIQAWHPGPYDSAGAALRAELGLPATTRLLGFIGRLSPEKDAPTAMEVARRVLSAVPDVHVLVVGDGADEGALPALVRQLGVGDRVHLLGYRPVTPALYQALDIYYMTSRTEGLPNTLLEAMACGRPSVVTSVGGIPELLGESGAAIQCSTGDSAAIADGIVALLRDPARAAAMGQAARARIEASFSFAERLRRIEAIYTELAQAHRTVPEGRA